MKTATRLKTPTRREPRFWMRVWDLPTRLFHWSVVILIATAYGTMRAHRMDLHMIAGETLLALLIFRLGWGLAGSQTARFGQFVRSPLAGLRHIARIGRREPDTEIGHNAAGGWMVLAMLAVLLAQVVFGLFAHTRRGLQGPLAHLVSPEWSDRFSIWHAWNFNLILAVIGLHILAILAYAVLKRQDLVRPMITGRKRLPGHMQQPRMQPVSLALAMLAASAALVWVLVTRL